MTTIIGNRYELLRPLGGGASGDVFLAKDIQQGDAVAVKLINPASLGGRPWNAEAEVLTGLRGERILPIRNAEIYAGQPLIVTDVAVNGTLDGCVPSFGVSAASALRWIRQACVGVQRIHDVGLLHCDIKPENLFLDEHMNVMVGDLGFATLRPPAGPSHNGNTPTTVAPEVAAACHHLLSGVAQPGMNSVASDVYSLGATMYYLVSGQWPHPWVDSELAKDRYERISTSPAVRLDVVAPHLRRDLSSRIEKALAVDPADRYESPGAMAAALGQPATRERVWVRTDEHVDHEQCFRGARGGKADATVCVVGAAVKRVEIVARRGTVRVPGGCSTNVRDTPAVRAQRLRAAFRATD